VLRGGWKGRGGTSVGQTWVDRLADQYDDYDDIRLNPWWTWQVVFDYALDYESDAVKGRSAEELERWGRGRLCVRIIYVSWRCTLGMYVGRTESSSPMSISLTPRSRQPTDSSRRR
jgi:hypothetical protein